MSRHESDPMGDAIARYAARAPEVEWSSPAEIRRRGTRRRRRRLLTEGSAASLVIAICVTVALTLPAGTTSHHPGTTGKLTSQRRQKVAVTAPGAVAVEQAEQGFALELTQKLLATAGDDNVAVSPESVEAALSMLELGARGRTQQAIARVLGGGAITPETQAEGWNALTAGLASDARTSGVSLADANELFLQKTLPVNRSYQVELTKNFGVQVAPVDFTSGNGATVVNQWAAAHTDGTVRQLFTPGALSHLTELVLTDAVHFSARWAPTVNFLKSLEAPGTFVSASGTRERVPMMHLESESQAYVSTRTLQAVVLPYAGDKFEAVAVEARTGSLKTLVDALRPAALTRLAASARVGYISVSMPEFSISSEPNLSDTLQAMGMAGAFAGGADYSGITSAPGVVLQQVAQADAITVNESGTNASAVSGVQSGRISQRGAIEEISFDRPFLFVIRDIATGAIVSDAVVADLSQP